MPFFLKNPWDLTQIFEDYLKYRGNYYKLFVNGFPTKKYCPLRQYFEKEALA